MGEGSRRVEGIGGEGIENDRLELTAESRACRICQRTELSEKRIGLQLSRLQDCFHPTPLYQVTSTGSGLQERFS